MMWAVLPLAVLSVFLIFMAVVGQAVSSDRKRFRATLRMLRARFSAHPDVGMRTGLVAAVDDCLEQNGFSPGDLRDIP